VRRWAAVGSALLLLATSACANSGDDDAGSSDGGNGGSVPGVTEDTVTLGIVFATQTQAGAAGVGASSTDLPIMNAAQAIVDGFNADGGILGRQIELVEAPFSTAVPSYSAEFQAVCSTLTEDNSVFATMTDFSPPALEVLVECLAEHRTILVADKTAQSFPQEIWNQWRPYVYSPGAQYFDKIAERLDQAGADGYFQGRKVGIISFDTDYVRKIIDDEVKPKLEELGSSVVSEITVTPSDASGDIGNTASAMVSGIVQFKEAGVDQVVFVGIGPEAPLTFVGAAAAQEFLPRYFVGTEINPTFQASTSPAAYSGARGVGWIPVSDIGDTTGAETMAGEACLAKVRDAGIDPTNDEGNYLFLCNYLDFIKAVVEEAGSFEADAIAEAYPNAPFQSSTGVEFSPGPDRTDGVTNARVFDFDDTCSCFRYTDG